MGGRRNRSHKRSPGKRSKQRSRRERKQKAHLPPLFLDDCLSGEKFAAALSGMGFRVEPSTSHFPRGTRDEIWVRFVGERKWLALTHDARIRQVAFERAAVERYRASLIVLRSQSGKGVGGWAEMIKKAERRLLRTMRTVRRPYILHVTGTGAVSVAWPPKKLKPAR